jgi:RND family efflux transporter MFP subunit
MCTTALPRTSSPLAALILGLGVSVVLSGCGNSTPEAQAVPSPRAQTERSQPVRAYTLAPRTLGRSVLVAGTVEPLRSIQLAARTDGVVAEVNVEAGDRVEAGQLLARIDVSEQQAELARAEAALREARANFERLDSLRDRDFVDAASVLSARSAFEVAQSEVGLWRTRVAFGRIEASIDGYVIERLIEPGAAVGRLAPAFVLADLDQLVLRVGVSELDAANIEAGREVEVAIDALPGETLPARVRRVFPSADASSRLVTVELEMPDAHARGVRPGFLARARLDIEARSNVLAVPAASVALGEQTYVMVIDADGRLQKRLVETGVVRGEWREILSGLEAGEQVVATSPLELAAGEQVRVVETLGGGA